MSNFRIPGGAPGALVAGHSIYETSAKPCCAVGTRLPLGDRVFYYAKFYADNAAGLVAAPDCSIGGPVLLADGSCCAIASPALGSLMSKKAITASLAVGDRGIGITHGSSLDNITAHMLVDGYILLTDSAGSDQIYKIKDNTAMASDIVEILLYDEIRVATADTTTGVAIMPNPFMNLTPATLDTDEAACGVPLVAVDVSEAAYAWVQTWGPCMAVCVTGTTAVSGDNIIISTTAGQVENSADGTSAIIGHAICDITANVDAGLVYLKMFP